ncbi:TonB-dependent siderophore receptor [Zoogloea sp.]|uniref:TonB-dependent siderophore receptor n=1 Tax=Zoogloea sp. TaxID=49181 RepID=UPI002617E13F|nr:TonB-dependent siderophore receptor [Zoogloea sp.]MDD3353921.1 TonB-dependent siderophore receptor [Zoogloea sp.]
MFTPTRITLVVAALYAPGLWAQSGDLAAGEVRTLPEVQVRDTVLRDYRADSATVAGKTPQGLREIPNSVSVLTRAQMDDQNMVTLWDALSRMTGVQAISNDITQGQFHARGSSLELQNDGMPSTLPLSGYQQFDLGMYDVVEVLRGPAGVLQGSGSFAGAVNLVRKRPEHRWARTLVAQTGTWSNNRLEADVTGPLNDSGSLRGRAVVSYIDRDYVYNRVHDTKWLAYGTLDFDFSVRTTGNLYFAYQDNDSTGFSGLPSYTDGRFLSVPRSFNPHADWNGNRWSTRDAGLELKHVFGNDWTATFRASRRDQGFFFKDGYPTAGVTPETMTIASYARREFDYDYRHESADVFAAGPLTLLGRKHELLVGANYSTFQSTGRGANPNSPDSAYLTVRNVPLSDPPAVPEPDVVYRTGSQSVTTQAGYYGKLTLNVADPFKAVLGARLSDYDYKSRTAAPNPKPTPWAYGGHGSGRLTPYAGLVYDLHPQLALYASYADIFVPQTQKRVDQSVLPPRVGKQYEVGTKTEFLDGKLLATLALFTIRDTNRALADVSNPGYFLAVGELESKGWEMEVVGSPWRGLDVSAGYTNAETRWINNGSSTGLPVSFWYPRQMLKLWTRYSFPEQVLRGVSLGLGVTAATQSASGAPTATVLPRTQNDYAVVRLQVGYAIDRRTALTLDINNVFDTTYYTRLGGTNTYNTYGDPRHVVLTLRVRYP